MRKAITLLGLLALVGSLMAPAVAQAAPAEKYRVFVFTSGAPAYAQKGVKAIRDLGKANGFGVQSNGDAGLFTEADLGRFRAVVFLDTTGSPLNAAQEAAFEAYFRNGGGFVGVGSAIETEPGWQFLTDILGTRSTGKLDAQTVDEQGRRPRTRREQEPARVLEPQRHLLQLGRERPRPEPRADDRQRRSLQPDRRRADASTP